MTYDAWKTTNPAELLGHACDRCHSDEGRYCWGYGDHRYLCADCLDDESFEAREPLVEQDIDQIDDEIFEYEGAL